MSDFKAILWDVDGTLLDFLYAQRIAISESLGQVGVCATEKMIDRYSAINDGYWKKLELGLVTKEELHRRRFTDLFEEYGITGVDVEAFRANYLSVLSNTYRYIDDSLNICRNLSGKIKQYVITNGVTKVQENKLRLSGLYDWMDGVFISEQIGVPKPQAGFFDYCFNVIDIKDLKKEELLIVGDSLTSDIKGGVLYGIPTCWYREEGLLERDSTLKSTYEQFTPQYEISHLQEIYSIVGVENIRA